MKPEILAPGGSPGAVYAAIRAGADAVYMGGKRFGARAFADNPDEKELLDIIDNVHLHNKKIYITVNTVLTEAELSPLYSYIDEIYRQGADALIVQDFGVMKFIHEHFPEMPIHASTQMSIMRASAVNMLSAYGVNRVVPARELSLDELRTFRKCTDSEIEVFVHGALCCSMSGQCLMSSMIGGRSGNRGACAQPCRKLYSYNGMQADYHLSLKDLCALPYLNELILCGIDSFKIEGRMKKPEYVALTAMMYKKYTDMYFELGYDGYREFVDNSHEFEKDMLMLKDIYNRGGFTCGYLITEGSIPSDEPEKSRSIYSDNTSVIIAGKRPGHEGVYVGNVISNPTGLNPDEKRHDLPGMRKNRPGGSDITIRFDMKTNPQDVLEIRDDKGNKIHEHTLKKECKPGDKVRINAGYNAQLIKNGFKVYRTRNNSLINMISDKFPQTMPKVPIEGAFFAENGKKAILSAEGVYIAGNVVQAADKHAATPEDVRKKIMVSGDSNFEWTDFKVFMGDDVFLPGGELKSLRRELFAKLREEMCGKYRRTGKASDDVSTVSEVCDLNRSGDYNDVCSDGTFSEAGLHEAMNKSPELIVECRNLEQFDIVNKYKNVDVIYLHTEDMEIEDARSALKNANKPLYIYLPRIFSNFREEEYLWMTEYESFSGFVVSTIEEIAWVDSLRSDHQEDCENLYKYRNHQDKQAGIRQPPAMRTADNLYVRNSYAYCCYRELGAGHCSLSVEMSENELQRFSARFNDRGTGEDVLHDMTGKINADVMIYGKVPVMIMRNHIGESGTLKDEYGNTYNMIAHKKSGYTEILNYEVRNLNTHSGPTEREWYDRYDHRIVFTDETPSQLKEVLKED